MLAQNRCNRILAHCALWIAAAAFAPLAAAQTVFFSTGNPDGKMATLARLPLEGQIETETADDFVLTTPMRITQATFTGLLPTGAPLSSITGVDIELYHVFPADSTNPPSGNVPTRANSPSDVEFAGFDSSEGTLIYTAAVLNSSFSVLNTVVTGIHKVPNQLTGGEGPATGQEVQFTVTFTPPIILPADHYFFRPEVQLSSGNFLWLSAPKPIVAPGTPFTGDLQSWIRNDNLDPDWLRVGTDITGQGPFNAAFSLTGDADVGSSFFNTGTPDGKIATLAQSPQDGVETESADDFILATPMRITQAAFTGLLPPGAPLSNITGVDIELYHVFPVDSVNPPSGRVPTRANSPSDVEFADFNSVSPHTLFYTPTLLNSTFTVSNTVINGIHPSPNQLTGGEGSTTGQEVLITVTFNPPIVLQADHIFFRPEVTLSSGDFLWLSAPKPIVAPGTPFTGDLQSWIRNEPLEPDWLRIGTDITAQGPFNAAFSLVGDTELPTCSFSLYPTSVPALAQGGQAAVTVTNEQNCEWTATSNSSFITVNIPGSGVGTGLLSYAVQPNTGAARSGTLTIGGQTFTVNQAAASGSAPPAVTVFSPGQGATNVSTSVSLTWGAVSGATSYDVLFGTTPSPSLIGNTAGTSFSPGPLAPGTTYYWIVTAKNAFGSTPSALWFFTTAGQASCSFTLSSTSLTLPATGTSTPETCPNNSGQPNCGVNPETARSFTVTPSAACGTWTATSSNPSVLQIRTGASGSGSGTVSFVLLNNTHNGQQNYTITVAGGGTPATFAVTETGSGDNQVFREVYALYEQLLGRDPDAAGFAFWTGSGGAGLGQMADSFLTSPESFNSDFAVMAAYQAATGAPPLFAQYNAAVTAVRAGTQSITGLFNSLIGGGYTATTLYQNLLSRAPTAAEINSANNAGLANWFETLIGFPNSTTPVNTPNNEFQSTGSFHTDHSNSLYVRMVYYVTVSRDPDPAGFNFWLGVANNGGPGLLFQGAAGFPTRIQILGPGTPNQGFIGSPEFQGLFAN